MVASVGGAIRLRSPSPAVRILGGVDELMFNSGDLRLALEAQTKKMVEAVEAEPEKRLVQADVDQWAAALAHHFAVLCPSLHINEVWMDEVQDVKVDVSHDQMRYFSDYASDLARSFPGYRVVVHVPQCRCSRPFSVA
jgi:hypothetical protein